MTRVRRYLYVHLAIAGILVACPSFATAFDQRLVATWDTAFNAGADSFQATWTIAGDGKYEVRTTSTTLSTREVGLLTAEAGRWSKQSTTGSDGGAYWLEAQDRLTLTGS